MSRAKWSVELKSVTWPLADQPPVFDDLLDVDYTAMTVIDELAGFGSAEVTTALSKLNATTKARLLDGFRNPMELWAYRNGICVFAGPLVGIRIDGGTIGLSASGLLAYLGVMALSTRYVRSSVDQVTIVKDLIDTYQALEYGNWGLDTTGLVESGVTRQFALLPTSGMTFDRVVDDLAPNANGFDLWAQPATRRLHALSRRGSDLSAGVIIDDRQITSTSWSASFAPGQVATDIIATTQAPGGGEVVTAAGNATLRAVAGRRTLPVTIGDVTSRGMLEAYAQQAVYDHGSQVVTVAQGMLPVDIPFGGVGAGDMVTIDQDFGLGPTSSVRRISRMAVSSTSAGERLAVDFV